MPFPEKPSEYWVRMGEIGEMIASIPFSNLMQDKYGRVQRIVNGHDELHKSDLYPIDNFDDEARHLDLVAADMRPNLCYWIYGIAEVKSTLSRNKMDFKLNGLCPQYMALAKRNGIPLYFIVVRFPSPLPDDIVTDEGSVRAFFEFKDRVSIEVYSPGEFWISGDDICVGKPPTPPPSETPSQQSQTEETDDECCARLIKEAQKDFGDDSH